jgi:hypothetical protein
MRSDAQKHNDARMRSKPIAATPPAVRDLLKRFAGFPECQKMIRKLASPDTARR